MDEQQGIEAGPASEPGQQQAAESRDSVRRDPLGRWMPGSSGNVLGRPAVPWSVRALARQHTELAIGVLAAIAADRGASTGARILAARELLDRGHGRPSPTELPADLSQVDDDELDRLVAEEEQAALEDLPPALEHARDDLAHLSDEELERLHDE